MQKATCSEVALLGGSEYPDHGVGPDDPGLMIRVIGWKGDRHACYSAIGIHVIAVHALRLVKPHRTRWRRAHNQCR